MSKSVDLAIVGAANAAGEIILELLAERAFPVGTLRLLAADDSVGNVLQFKGKNHKIEPIKDFDFSNVQLVIFATDATVSSEFVPVATEAGCIVIDNSTAFRDDNILVVADINPDAIASYKEHNIIVSLSSFSNAILIALNSIHHAADITRINIATYQAVSGFNKKGVEELAGQTANLLNMRPLENKLYPKQIAFNVLPQIGDILENGYTQDEMEITSDIQRVLGKDSIAINVTAVRVPVFYGDAAVLNIETRQKIGVGKVRELLGGSPAVAVIEGQKNGEYPTAVSDASGNDEVFIGRVREDVFSENGLNMWIVVDRMRKCVALNSVQIAEILVKDYL